MNTVADTHKGFQKLSLKGHVLHMGPNIVDFVQRKKLGTTEEV